MSDETKKCDCPDGKVRNTGGKCVYPEITFSSFIMSLNTSALFHLGELAHPETGKKVKDLDLAKHSIDLLNLLEKKTEGNLDDEEHKLLSSVLYELKMHYVAASSQKG
ncbi:MAG: DUF1844 domain-containing protein [Desulfobulbaceae bacterium]|nr:DUF1844 domain-containing protein [Desulfobulbaceae bacterium]